MHYVLIGNYGVGNLGDEALKEYFLEQFPDAQWSVVSASPAEGEFYRLPAGIRSFFTPWWRTIQVLKKADGVVFGGGTLFTDAESVYACFLWWLHVCIAKILGCRILMAFQGIGPFRSGLARWFAQSALGKASFISVRDEDSLRRAESFKLNTKVVHSFDPVFSFINKQKEDNSTNNVFIVVPRSNSPDSFKEKAGEIANFTPWEEIRILSLQPDDLQEQKLCSEIQEVVHASEIIPIRSLQDLAEYVSQASYVLTQRYHAALAALALGVRFEAMPQKEGDKHASLAGLDAAMLSGLVEYGEEELRRALMAA